MCKWLRRLPEIHGILCLVILVYGVVAIPAADSFFPEQFERCSWYGWIGFPGVICPGDTTAEAVYAFILNLPTLAATTALIIGLLIAAGPSEWAGLELMLSHPTMILGLVQVALLLVLLFRGLRVIYRTVCGLTHRSSRPYRGPDDQK